MLSKIKILMVAWVLLGFVAFPFTAVAGGYPPGDNSVGIVGVPGPWKPKVEGQSNGSGGGAKFPAGDNSVAIVGVPGPWKPSTKSNAYKAGVGAGERFPKGDNSWAIVGVPKPWAPK